MDVEPKIGGFYPQNGWFIMENPIKMDDLGGFPPIFGNTHILSCIEKCSFHKGIPLGFLVKNKLHLTHPSILTIALKQLFSPQRIGQLRLRFDQISGWIFRGSNRHIPK